MDAAALTRLAEDATVPAPPDEAVRLELLRHYGIVDTAPEPAFDDLARIAAQICGTPMAAVSLVDADRQWFKASVGLDSRETPREQAFCAHAILNPHETLVVADAREDPRFADNPLVAGDPGIRFYAGAPLVTAEGHGLGSLCVIDTEPRVLSPEQTEALRALSRLVMDQLETRRSLGVLSVAFAEREVAAAAARDYEERFRLAFEKASVGMALTSPDGRLLQVNDRYCRLLGRPESELVGIDLNDLNHPDFRDAELAVRQRLLSGAAQVMVRERRYLRPDGGESWGHVTTSLVRSAEGSPLYFVSQVEDVTERKLAEQALDQTRSVGDAIMSADEHGRITAWNPGAEAMFGYGQDEVLGTAWAALLPRRHLRDQRRGFAAAVTAAGSPTAGRVIEVEAVRRDGTEFPIELSIGRSRTGGTVSFTAVVRDVSERRRAADELQRQATFVELLRAIAVAANEATTAEEAMRRGLEHVGRLTGWCAGHLLYPDSGGFLRSSGVWWTAEPDALEEFRRLCESLRYGPDEGPGRVLAARTPVWATANAPRDPGSARTRLGIRLGLRAAVAFPVLVGDEVVAVLEFLADCPVERDSALLEVLAQVGTQLGRVVERARAQDRLARQALHDPLTGLPNRALLLDRLDQALSGAARQDRSVATLVMDLDRFQLVNDSLGHGGGDEVLALAARRLESVVRTDDTVARLGSDEFVVLCGDLADPAEATAVAHRVVQAFAEPFALRNREAFVGISVGIAYGAAGDQPATLARDADTAMRRAKGHGGNRYEIHDGTLRADAVRRLVTDSALHRALERGEFRLLYQPIVRLADGAIEGVEALLRWEHPEHGLVPPDDFITLIEANGLIEPIGAWVLRESCAQLGRWRHEFGGSLPLRMAVNLSARQLGQADLAAVVRDALASADIPVGRLTLEITETVSMRDAEGTLARLHELRDIGVELAIDDFGTGYSSLDYLDRLPVDVLKIDRAFVARIAAAGGKPAIVNAVIELGGALDLTVVAEGIETTEQAAYLRDRGCELGQGFLFARPLAAEAVSALLKDGAPLWTPSWP